MFALVSAGDEPPTETAVGAGPTAPAETATAPDLTLPVEEPSADEADGPTRPGGQVSRTALVTTVLPAPVTDCAPASVLVAPSVTGRSVAEKPVRLQIAVGTTADLACRIELGADELLLQVVGPADEVVWDAAACATDLPDRELTLRPGWQQALSVTWSGAVAGRRCAESAPAAEPGTYEIRTALLGGEPAAAELVLSAAPKPDRDRDKDRHQNRDQNRDRDRGQDQARDERRQGQGDQEEDGPQT